MLKPMTPVPIQPILVFSGEAVFMEFALGKVSWKKRDGIVANHRDPGMGFPHNPAISVFVMTGQLKVWPLEDLGDHDRLGDRLGVHQQVKQGSGICVNGRLSYGCRRVLDRRFGIKIKMADFVVKFFVNSLIDFVVSLGNFFAQV
jgi:hypothetical protein